MTPVPLRASGGDARLRAKYKGLSRKCRNRDGQTVAAVQVRPAPWASSVLSNKASPQPRGSPSLCQGVGKVGFALGALIARGRARCQPGGEGQELALPGFGLAG